MTSRAPAKLEHDFLYSTGAAILEWASDPVAYYKILNDTAFARFQQGGSTDFEGLFTRSSPETLRTSEFGTGLVGEFFDRVKVGRNISVGNDVNMIAHGGIAIGDDVRISDNVQLVTVFHSIHPDQRLPIRTSPIVIEEGAVIEAGALIISSRRSGEPLVIGRNSRVLAGAVVVANVAENAIVAGRPARPVGLDVFLQDSFETASEPQTSLTLTTKQQVQLLLGDEVDVSLPISVRGTEHVSSDGFYLLNRRCTLELDGATHIGQNVLMAPAVSLTVEPGASLTIGSHVWVGAGATIHAKAGQNLTIGSGSIIGAGATITENVPPHVVMLEENLIKRQILPEDFDRGIPQGWTDIASILDLRSQDRVDRVQQEIDLLLSSGQDLRDLMRIAHAEIRKCVSETAVVHEGPEQFSHV